MQRQLNWQGWAIRAKVASLLAVAAFGSLLLGAHRPAWAQSSAPEYVIRQSDPSLGTNIRRAVVSGGTIPLNRRYDELTADEKAAVRELYEGMDPADEPPFPANGLKPMYDAIQQAHERRFHVRGEMTLVATVGPAGDTLKVEAIRSPDPDMTRFAASVLFATKFKPAVCQGQPCTMDYPLRMRFRRGD
jgi:hypothetical protein